MADRILIVEDNELNLRLFTDLLQSAGYEVATARSGMEALDAAQEARPALILMDVQLPSMSGIEAARRIRESGPERVPILAVSAFPRRRAPRELDGVEDYCDDYLVKPVLPATLLDAVHRHLPARRNGAAAVLDRPLPDQRITRCPVEY